MRKYQQNKLIISNYQKPCVEKHVKIKVLKKVFYNLNLSYKRTNYHLCLENPHTTYHSITRNKNYCSVTFRARSVSKIAQRAFSYLIIIIDLLSGFLSGEFKTKKFYKIFIRYHYYDKINCYFTRVSPRFKRLSYKKTKQILFKSFSIQN